MASLYRTQVNHYLSQQSFEADQVLDVGFGAKEASKLAQVKCNRYMTMDIDGELKPSFIHDINEFAHADDLFALNKNPRFDLIFCLHVFEYVWNPYNAVANLYNWLADDGMLVVNLPFLYPIHNPVGMDYLRYTHEWVYRIFQERFKFREIEITPIVASEGAGALREFYSLEKMHTRKGDPTWMEIGCIVKARK